MELTGQTELLAAEVAEERVSERLQEVEHLLTERLWVRATAREELTCSMELQ